MKSKMLVVTNLFVFLLVGTTACSTSSDDTTSNQKQLESETITDDSAQSSDSPEENTSNTESKDNRYFEATTNKANEDEIQEDHPTNTVTKLEGRRSKFIERLDNIQKELDASPEKNDSDKGVTNAMKSYYGRSYEMYDKALNEIYAVLKKELSPEEMKNLKTSQINWIKQKESTAEEERLNYKGGTSENVVFYVSLYESTKDRCYELVNEYMTD